MTKAEQYRAKAKEFAALAGVAKSSRLQVSLTKMAEAYFRLARAVDESGRGDSPGQSRQISGLDVRA